MALEGWGRYNSVLGQCGTHESWFSHAKELDKVLGSSQVALEGWGRYNSALGQCGTHESWFSHAKELDKVLGYRQVAVGTA